MDFRFLVKLQVCWELMALTNEVTEMPGAQDSYDQDSSWGQKSRRVFSMWTLNGWPRWRLATEMSGATVEGAFANDAFDTVLDWLKDTARGTVLRALEEPKMVN